MNAERLLTHYEQIADAPDAIARLRRFILDLAVRGKLVPQDPNDEPASELLKRIAKEKARLVKAGEIRTPKVLPDVEEPPFDLPRNWRWTPIREVATDRGQEIPQSIFTYIDVTAINKVAGVVADPKVLEASEAPSRARKITRKGDVIYSCVRPYLLNVAVIETDFDPQPIASTAFAILNGHGLVMPRYIWIVLRSPFMVACVEENQRGQAYPAINDADFAVLPFPLPPLVEQHRIVAKVDELMGLCDRLEAARAGREAVRDRLAVASLARLNAPDPESFKNDARFALDALPALTTRPDQIRLLRQTILNLAVRGKLVPQDAKDEPASELLKRIATERTGPQAVKKAHRNSATDVSRLRTDTPLPVGWLWTNIDEISLSMRYGTSTKCDYAAKGVPVLRIPNVSDGVVSLDDIKFGPLTDAEIRDLALNAGDLLMIRSNGSLDIVGRSAVVTAEADGMAFAGYLVRLRLSLANIKPEYIWRALNSTDVRDQIEKPIRSAVGLKNVNLTEFGALTIPLPPLAEQRRIVAKVDALMELCDRLEASLTATAATRRRLLDALLAEALAPADDRELEAAE
jgi:type I restriction enzyme, S subunit